MRQAITILFLLGFTAFAGTTVKNPNEKPQKILYKEVKGFKLHLHVFAPAKKSEKPAPAIIFYFGGGWNGGSPSQFYPHAKHLASKGIVAFCAEYRVKKVHKATPFECVEDAKSAMRFLRKNAKKFGIDPNKIIAGGGSAGGHLAAATATVKSFDAKTDDKTISAVPNALVLFNPVYDNGPKGYGHDRVKAKYKEFSPMHNITSKMPPAIVFLGTKDRLIPVSTGEKFRDLMKEAGVKSELHVYKGQPHGFVNFRNKKYYDLTVKEMDRFLKELGFLK